PQRLPERRRHDQGAGRHLDGTVTLGKEPPVRGGEPEAHQTVAVPHSGQYIPVAPSWVPQLVQNFLAATGAAARAVPHCWQNLPPPVSCSQDGQRATAVSR